MIKYLTRAITNRAASSMQARYDYDTSYMREVAAVSSGGALRLGLLPLLSQYSAGCGPQLWSGACMASTLDGDCGPCLQLVVNVALERGVPPALLRAALQGGEAQAGQVGLGFRFARAAINDTSDLESLRAEIIADHGEQAVVSLALVAATGRTWPVIKRGLGHGRVCQSVRIEDVVVDVASPTAALLAEPA